MFHQISAYARIREHDALLAAGDLLDMFSDTSFTEQKSTALIWKNTVLKSGKSLAWCSGNHDFFRGDCTPMSLASPFWMRESPSNRFFITDGESRLLETSNGRIAVTTLPWPAHGSELVVDGYRTTYVEFVANLLSAGKKIKDEKGVPWIVLNHEPPGGTPLSATDEAPEANLPRKLIEVAQPDFSLHGHIHQAPTAKDGSWIWQFGETVCFNPGQSLPGEPLHYIVLNWRAPGDWTATWSGAGRMLCVESDTKNSS